MSTSSSFLNLQTSYYIDLNEDHEILRYHQSTDHHDTAPIELLSKHPQSSIGSASSLSSSSSVPSPCSNQVQDQAGYCFMGSQLHTSAHHPGVSGSYEQAEINKGTNNILKFSICRKDDKSSSGGGGSDGGAGSSEINHSSVNWMPPKMRLTKRMVRIEEDRKQHPPPFQVRSDANFISKPLNEDNKNNNNNNKDNTMIRVCSDCNTTKTPLWRSGPRGPKSLCNACGIRQRKARRAMAAAASGSFISNSLSSSMMRDGNSHKKGSNKNNVPGAQKKRCKVANKPPRDHHHNTFQRKLCFEEFSLNLTKKLSLHQVFPKEEKEAAILLMALSCGLVQG